MESPFDRLDLGRALTGNDVDNYVHELTTRFGTLPPDMQLTVEAHDATAITSAEAMGYLAFYATVYGNSVDAPS